MKKRNEKTEEEREKVCVEGKKSKRIYRTSQNIRIINALNLCLYLGF